MSVVVEIESQKTVRVFTKGATENIIANCSTHISSNSGETQQFEAKDQEAIKENVVRVMAQQALRTIALAYKDISYEQFRAIQQHIEDKLNTSRSENNSSVEDLFEESKYPEEEQDQRQFANSIGVSLDKDMTLIGVFGIRDDLRKGIKEAVRRCH